MNVSKATTYQVVAENFSEAHENRMHSDAVAQRYGFKSALVPGVAVFGHLTHPLVERFGEHWLSNSLSEVRFFKPAYHGDPLTITWVEDATGWHLQCVNGQSELLAELHSSMPAKLPDPEPPEVFSGPQKDPERIPVSWETVVPQQTFSPWHWQVTEERNRTFATQVADSLPIYRTRAHPHLLLSEVNRALTQEYTMPAWLHVGSEIRLRKLIKVPDVLRSHTVVLEKWRKNGHEFARTYTTYQRDGVLVTDVYHTLIFSVGR
jgi:acyl dehydratase